MLYLLIFLKTLQTSTAVEQKHTRAEVKVLPTLFLLSCTIHSSKTIFHLCDMGSTLRSSVGFKLDGDTATSEAGQSVHRFFVCFFVF